MRRQRLNSALCLVAAAGWLCGCATYADELRQRAQDDLPPRAGYCSAAGAEGGSGGGSPAEALRKLEEAQRLIDKVQRAVDEAEAEGKAGGDAGQQGEPEAGSKPAKPKDAPADDASEDEPTPPVAPPPIKDAPPPAMDEEEPPG